MLPIQCPHGADRSGSHFLMTGRMSEQASDTVWAVTTRAMLARSGEVVGGKAPSNVRQEFLQVERLVKRRVCQVRLRRLRQVN